jgi:FkbM family methyltransferase
MSQGDAFKVRIYERVTTPGRLRRAHRMYDQWTFDVINRVVDPDSNCVDVGCHEGLILEGLIAAAPNGRHFAFEPIPSLAAKLRDRFPQVEVHEVALSDEPGRASFVHVTSNPGYSGLRERRYDRPSEDLENIDVEVSTLDELLPPDLPIRFIKIDVEGAELGVLRGGARTIERWKPYVVFEHGLGAADCYGTRPEAVWDLLDGLGLQVSLLDRFLKRRRPLTRDDLVREFDRAGNYYFIAYPA